jgi:hypothetical protein
VKELLIALAVLIAPRAAVRADTLAIIDAAVFAVEHDPEAPIFGSREADAAVLLYTAWRESEWYLHAVGDHGRALGAWQLQFEAGRGDARKQAVVALQLLHWAARVCPDLPAAAYLSGRCDRARVQAGQRMNRVARLLERLDRGASEMQTGP